jgi:hypothetical protein
MARRSWAQLRALLKHLASVVARLGTQGCLGQTAEGGLEQASIGCRLALGTKPLWFRTDYR